MPNRQKQKGDRFERKIVGLLKKIGCDAQRVPLSGGAGGEFSGDIRIRVPTLPRRLVAECKDRADQNGYRQIVQWLDVNDLLFLNIARGVPVVAMPWNLFVELLNVRATVERNSIPSDNTVVGYGDGDTGDETDTKVSACHSVGRQEDDYLATEPTVPILPNAPES